MTDGFYWIRYRGEVSVAKREDGWWLIPGGDWLPADDPADDPVEVLSERLEPPSTPLNQEC